MPKLPRLYLFVFLLCFIGIKTCYAQQKKPQNLPHFDEHLFHFGFSFGINNARFNVITSKNFVYTDSLSSIIPSTSADFHLAIVSNLHISKHFDLRFIPGLTFANRDLNYAFSHVSSTGIAKPEIVLKSVQSIFVDLPLELKFKSNRINNHQLYVIIGFKYSIDKASRKEDKSSADNIPLKLEVTDFGYEIGFGVDIYSDFSKFSPEIKMFNGLKNILIQDNTVYSKPIDRLFSKILTFSFTIEG